MKFLIFGATGLIGNELLHALSSLSECSQIFCLGRTRPRLHGPKIEFIPWNGEALSPKLKDALIGIDHAFCALGTTLKKAGSKAHFLKVDRDLVLGAANLSKQLGIKNFSFVSSHGANKTSNYFYLRTKGEVEEALQKLDFQTLHILRPSFLLGKRSEFRLGESIFGLLAPAFSPFLIGPLRDVAPISAKKVAAFMAHLAIKPPPTGCLFHSSGQIQIASNI